MKSNRRKIGVLSSAAALAVAGFASCANADLLSAAGSTWSESTNYTAGTTAQTDPNDFTISNIAASPQSAALARFTPQTLAIGSTIELTGDMSITSTATVGTQQFRFGLYNDNGSAGETGWLGYTMQAGNGAGNIEGKNSGNSNTGPSNGGTYSISMPGSNGTMGTGTYAFSLALTYNSSTSMTISESLLETTGGTYSWANTVTDTGGNGGSVSTNKFDAVEFFTAAGQVDAGSTETFTNVQVNYPVTVAAANSATWQPGGTGNWSNSSADNGNWVNATPPANSNSSATFDNGGATSGPVSVNVTVPEQVSTLTFNNSHGYTLAGAAVTVTSLLTSTAGANTINALNIGTSTLSISAGSSLSATTLTHAQYDTLNVTGGGTLNIGAYSDPQGSLEVTGDSTVNLATGIAAGNFFYDLGVQTANSVINLGTNNAYDSNSMSGPGTIVIGAGSTLTTDEFNGFSFSGSLSGSGSLILGSDAGSASGAFTGAFLGTSPNFTGPIDATFDSTIQVGTGATLGAGGANNILTLDSGILQAAGNTTLNQNIVIEDTLGISAIPNTTTIDTQTNTLTLTGNISGPNTLMKIGTGTLVVGGANSYSGGTSVSAGELVVNAKNALPTGALTISSGAEVQLATGITAGTQSANTPITAPTSSVNITSLSDSGTLDITNNHLIINYGGGADPIASVESLIKSGFNGGTWTGTGITSSAAAANAGSYGIGYADSADPGNPAGLSSGQIEVMYTLLGDANLDGKVNGGDFTILASNFNQGGKTWDQGDFNYDGNVNGADFTLLAGNFNQSATQSAIGAADLAALDDFAAANGISLTSVPEPASMGLILLAGVGAMSRRRRGRSSNQE